MTNFDEEKAEDASMVTRMMSKALNKQASYIPSTFYDPITETWIKIQVTLFVIIVFS